MIKRIFFLFFACIALSGCLITFPEQKKIQIYTLQHNQEGYQNDMSRFDAIPYKGQHLYIAMPNSYKRLNSDRIYITKYPLQMNTLESSIWLDDIPQMFQSALADRFIQTKKLKGVYRNQHKRWSNYHLSTEITDFHYAWDQDKAQGTTIIRIIATLVDGKSQRPIDQQVFVQTVNTPEFNKAAIIQNFNQAHQNIIDEIILWTLNRI